MLIQLEMGPEFQQTVRELGAMGTEFIAACSEGLGKGVKVVAGYISADYLSGQALHRRTGALSKAVDGWLAAPLDGVIGVVENSGVDKYKWILGDEQMTITPKRASALTIPIGEALTGAGVPRYESVRDAASQLGTTIFRPKGTNVLGYKKGKKGKFRPLFALVKSVFVQGSGALLDGTMDHLDDISGEIEKRIEEKI
jgi:hypothetical protein